MSSKGPEIGDSVWFFDTTLPPNSPEPNPPLAAVITRTDLEERDHVNIFIMTPKGVGTQANNILLVAPADEAANTEPRYCTWTAKQKALVDLIPDPPPPARAVGKPAPPPEKPSLPGIKPPTVEKPPDRPLVKPEDAKPTK